ncbi:MAG: class I SAM-dependent methyltransferase [Cyanobacteria bacterium P01_F01_bin.150]
MTVTNTHAEYDTWAWLYNQTMGPDYAQNQMRSLQTILLNQLPDNAEILDLCCGTGHVMNVLIQHGYRVTGIDGSQSMLDYASRNARSAEIIQADARSFTRSLTTNTQFDAVISTSASLNHMMDLDDLRQVFRCVYNALKDGGRFTFDVNHADQMEKWWQGKIVEGEIESKYAWFLVPTYNTERMEGHFKVTLFQSPAIKPVAEKEASSLPSFMRRIIYSILKVRRLTRFRLKLLAKFHKWEKQWTRSQMTYPVKGYTTQEIITALQDTGFTNIKLCTVDGSPRVDSNHSAHFICQKSS